MEIYVKRTPLAECEEPILVVGLFEDAAEVPPALGGREEASSGMTAGILEAGDFKGKLKEPLALYPPKTESGPGRIL
ncbi:MAG: hypothetical protein ACYS99_04610, partial [Planctomycetota bacterium]